MILLSTQDVLRLHQKVMAKTGGMSGVRDMTLLDSAVMGVRQTFDGHEEYPTVIDKAARLAFSLSRNHPFCDGNKRTSVLAMLVMLRLNGLSSVHSQERLVSFGLRVANGEYDYDSIRRWLRSNVRLG